MRFWSAGQGATARNGYSIPKSCNTAMYRKNCVICPVANSPCRWTPLQRKVFVGQSSKLKMSDQIPDLDYASWTPSRPRPASTMRRYMPQNRSLSFMRFLPCLISSVSLYFWTARGAG